MTNARSNLCQEPIAGVSMFVDACMELFNSTGEFLSWNLGKPKDPKPQCDGPHEHAPCASTARMGSHVGWFKNHISNPIIELAWCAISAQSLRDIGFRCAFQWYSAATQEVRIVYRPHTPGDVGPSDPIDSPPSFGGAFLQ